MENVKDAHKTDDDDENLGATSAVSEKLQKENCSFNNNHLQDPMDVDLAALEIWMELGIISKGEMSYQKALFQIPEQEGERKERKELRAAVKDSRKKTEIEKTILSKIKFDRKAREEKLPIDAGSFNNDHLQDPMDVDEAVLKIWKESGRISEGEMKYLKALLQIPERQGERKERKELRAAVKDSREKTEIEKTILSKIKFDKKPGEEINSLQRPRESEIPASENLMPGPYKSIQTERKQMNHDSGYKSPTNSKARDGNNVAAEKEQREDETSYQTASKGQMANTKQLSNTSNISGSRNTCQSTGSNSEIHNTHLHNSTVNVTVYTNKPQKLAIRKLSGTRK